MFRCQMVARRDDGHCNVKKKEKRNANVKAVRVDGSRPSKSLSSLHCCIKYFLFKKKKMKKKEKKNLICENT